MKKLMKGFMISILALAVLVSCEESKKVEPTTKTEGPETTDVKQERADVVSIKEAVNKEGITPNGDKVRYVYEVPVILIDKPGAQKINDYFQNVVNDLEARVDDGQLMPIRVESKAFLNDGIISVVMDINKTGPEGIYVMNYDMENDKEMSTKELLAKYQFDPDRLIAEINKRIELNESKPEEEQDFFSIDYFADTIITNSSDFPSQDDYLKEQDDLQRKTKEEKESFVAENIDKINAYINSDSQFVFIHRAALEDEELVVE